MQHSHPPEDLGMSYERALWAALALTTTFLIVEVVAGILTNSLALLSDAAQAAGASIDLVVEGGEAALSPQHATPVTLVMLECFNNALEHGFGGRGEQEHAADVRACTTEALAYR